MNNQLQNNIIEQLGYNLDGSDADDLMTYLGDVNNSGADAGYNGFTYYTETEKFFDDNRNEILSTLVDISDEMGTNVMESLASFRYLKDMERSIENFLLGLECDEADEVTIKNSLAWFALEEFAATYSN